MYCMKCGKETENEQVFCKQCLEVMDRYPIKPGTHVHLPHRNEVPVVKKQSRRRGLSAEEQIVHYKVLVRTLVALLGAVSVVLGIFIGLYFQQEAPATDEEAPIGQNYTVDPT